ncbi:MAG: hypothetical protein WAO56_09300 [Miniphocaeibacter sp.]|uniref:hypothetical protein n=1 Tax=Miniphocaeibacter sp. TaxID=3100973 RepID=UPI003BB2150E
MKNKRVYLSVKLYLIPGILSIAVGLLCYLFYNNIFNTGLKAYDSNRVFLVLLTGIFIVVANFIYYNLIFYNREKEDILKIIKKLIKNSIILFILIILLLISIYFVVKLAIFKLNGIILGIELFLFILLLINLLQFLTMVLMKIYSRNL